jgi:hypothetical protein
LFRLILLALLAFGFANCGKTKKEADTRRAQLFPNPVDEPATPPAPPAGAYAVAAGTPVEVEIADILDSDESPIGFFVHANIVENVMGPNGKVAIPAGSSCVILVRDSGKKGGSSFLNIALYQITVEGRSYLMVHGVKHLATLDFKEDSSGGVGHRNVHFESRSRLRFTLSEAVTLAR